MGGRGGGGGGGWDGGRGPLLSSILNADNLSNSIPTVNCSNQILIGLTQEIRQFTELKACLLRLKGLWGDRGGWDGDRGPLAI